MGQELPDNLDMLRAMVSRLNAATTEASAVVSAVEEYLGEELCIGVSGASRPFDSQRVLGDGERELLVTSHLAFGRLSGRERVYVLKVTLEKAEWKEQFTKIVNEECTPWSACSREVKLQSFALLPELLGNLATRVEEVAVQTSRTVQTVRDLLDAMRQPAPPAELEPLPPPTPEPAPAHEPEPSPPPSEAISLHELTASSAPNLFKRPRPKVMTGNGL
jgi:hypothetical protein